MNALSINIPANFVADCNSTLKRYYEHTKVLRMVYRLGQKNRAATMQWSPGRLCKSPRLCKQKIILGQHQAQPKARAPAEIRSPARGNQKIGG